MNKNKGVWLQDVSFITVLKTIESSFVGCIGIKQDTKPGFYIWIDEGKKVIAVTGEITRIIDKLELYGVIKNKIVLNEIYTKGAIGHPVGINLTKIYNVKPQIVKRLFDEQIEEIVDRITQTEGIVSKITLQNRNKLPWSEMTGETITIEKLIIISLEKNFKGRYLNDIPDSNSTIISTNVSSDIDGLDSKDYQEIVRLCDRNLSLRQIARQLEKPTLEIQKKVYILEQLNVVEQAIPEDKLFKYAKKILPKSNSTSRIKIHQRTSWTVPIASMALINLFLIILSRLGAFSGVEMAILDRYFKMRGRSQNEDITLVTVAESDISALARYPIPDRVMTKALNNLLKHEPTVIGIDIYRDLPTPPGNDELLETFEKHENIIGVEKLGTIPGPPVLRDYGMVGFADLDLDSDGILRRALISVQDDIGITKVGFGSFLAIYALSEEENALQKEGDEYLLKGKPLPYLTDSTGGYWKTKINGLQTMLDYQHREEDFDRISFSDLLAEKFAPQLVKDRIIILGVTAESKKDFIYSPYSRNNQGKSVPQAGMVAHANITSQLLDFAREDRKILTINSKLWEIGYFSLWLLIGIGAGTIVLRMKKGDRTPIILAQTGLLAGSSYGVSYWAFLSGWWIPTVVPAANAVIAFLLVKLQYQDYLQNLLYVDRYLGAYNKHYFQKNLKNSLDLSRKTKSYLGLILLQIEHPDRKQKNSRLLSKQLKVIVQLIQSQVEYNDDFVARYSQNTLAIVVENTTYNLLEGLRNRILLAIKNEEKLKGLHFKLGLSIDNERINNEDALILVAAENFQELISK